MKFSVDALRNIGRKRSTVEDTGKEKRAIAKRPRQAQVAGSPSASTLPHQKGDLGTGDIPVAVDDVDVPPPPPSEIISAGVPTSSLPTSRPKQSRHGSSRASDSRPESPQPEEEMTTMRARVKANTSALSDKKLAEQLLDMILLPRDQEERRSRSIDEVFTDLFPQLLSLVHDVFILKEASQVSSKQTDSLRDEAKAARAKVKVAEVKAARLEEELQSLRTSMEDQLAKGKAYAADLEIKLGDATSKGMILESKVETLQLELRRATVEVEETKKEVNSARQQAVEDYRGSQDFEDEVGEAAFDAFEKGFEDCKEKVGRAFPHLDLSHILVVEPEQHVDVGGVEAEEDVQEVEFVKPVATENVNASTVVADQSAGVAPRSLSVRETVMKTMADVDVLITTVMGSKGPDSNSKKVSPE